MKKIIMLVGLACGALVADAINVTLDLTPPQSAWELRRKRTEEMRKALRIDEAKREALRYERRKRILNKAAKDLQRIFDVSNKIVKVMFDFKRGDILVDVEDGENLIQRYDSNVLSSNPHIRHATGLAHPIKRTSRRSIKKGAVK